MRLTIVFLAHLYHSQRMCIYVCVCVWYISYIHAHTQTYPICVSIHYILVIIRKGVLCIICFVMYICLKSLSANLTQTRLGPSWLLTIWSFMVHELHPLLPTTEFILSVFVPTLPDPSSRAPRPVSSQAPTLPPVRQSVTDLRPPVTKQTAGGSFRAPLRQLPAYLCNCCSVMSVFPQAVAVPNTTRSERVSIHSPPLTTKKIRIVIAIMTIMIMAHIWELT